jgi:hypothetical protein
MAVRSQFSSFRKDSKKEELAEISEVKVQLLVYHLCDKVVHIIGYFVAQKQ